MYRRAVLPLAAIVLSSAAYCGQAKSAEAVQSNTSDWQGIKFGINEKTLLESGKNLTKFERTQRIERPVARFSDYKIEDYNLVGMPARVSFYFGKESKTLELIYVELKGLTKVDGEINCWHLEVALSQKYGAPVHKSDKLSSISRSLDANWISGNLNVSLGCLVGEWNNIVTVRYFPYNGNDTSGL